MANALLVMKEDTAFKTEIILLASSVIGFISGVMATAFYVPLLSEALTTLTLKHGEHVLSELNHVFADAHHSGFFIFTHATL